MLDDQVLRLVMDQNSPDNNVRTSAELNFNQLASQSPSQVSFKLILSAASEQLPLDVRQSCLLHLKRLVPKFWSIGFQLFVGPPIDQELKQIIRTNLLELATTSAQLKIRSGSAYVIVQIAAADYPDEWPDLLGKLYECSTNFSNETSVVGGLAVLNDLFDDLISEEQFWEGGVGSQLITHITNMLSQESLPGRLKTSALKLYLTVFSTLLSAEALELKERRSSVTDHVVTFSELLSSLLENLYRVSSSSSALLLVELHFRCYLYKTFSLILNNFKKFVAPQLRRNLLSTIVLDLSFGAKVFDSVVIRCDESTTIEKSEDLDDPQRYVTDYICELFLTLSLLQHGLLLSETLPAESFTLLVQNLVQCSILPEETLEEYTANFNFFVTDISGLSTRSTVRDAIAEFLMDLNDKDASTIFNTIRNETVNPQLEWKIKESYLFLAESLFLNEDSDSMGQELPLNIYLTSLNELIGVEQGPSNHPLVVSRIILLLPRFFEKFSLMLSVNSFGANEFKKTIAYAASSSSFELSEVVRAASLVCTTLWRNVPQFTLSKIANETQVNIFKICMTILEDSDEDTLPVLLEAISVAIDIDHQHAFQAKVDADSSVIDLIFKISFKDPANIQLTIDSAECLQTLLREINMEQYLQVCQELVPFILEIIGISLSASSVEYSPELYLALDLLGYIIGASPTIPGQDPSNSFPSEVFTYIFPVLKDLILRANDDQILQNGGEVFNNLLQKASKFFIEFTDPNTKQPGLQVLLEVASKFLSPELSDSAAMNCGLIVISLFENFQPYLDSNFFFQLLQATVRRLVIAKEVVTIENLIMVFCKLLLNTSPAQLIDALTSVSIEDKEGQTKSGLALVLPIWFNSFEITRGFEKIKQNILALGKIFSINDERIANMIVDGDLIPYDGDLIVTRSMAKSMPEKYTQIPAPLKILKLLASELGFQSQQPDPNDFLPENAESDKDDDGNEEWEDMDDIGVPNYEKLKSYVESDDEGDYGDDSTDQGIKDMLVQFFRECTSKNLGNFQQYYEMLSDDEKRIVTESLVF